MDLSMLVLPLKLVTDYYVHNNNYELLACIDFTNLFTIFVDYVRVIKIKKFSLVIQKCLWYNVQHSNRKDM